MSEDAASTPVRIDLRYVIDDAISSYTDEHPEWSPHQPDDAKELARSIRNQLTERFTIIAKVDPARVMSEAVSRCTTKCGTPQWRGQFCEFHQGYEDGIDAVLRSEQSQGGRG